MKTFLQLLGILRALVLISFALLLVLVGSLIYALRTPADMERLEQTLNRVLAEGGVPLAMHQIRWQWPLRFDIARLEMSDAQGIWLIAEGVSLVWSGEALPRGILRLDQTRITDLTVQRSPLPVAVPTSHDTVPSVSVSRWGLPALPLTAFEAREVSIARVRWLQPPAALPRALFPDGVVTFILRGGGILPLSSPTAGSASPPGATWQLTAEQAGIFTLNAQGTLSPDGKSGTGAGDLILPDLTPWGRLFGLTISGPARLNLRAQGPLQNPQLQADLELTTPQLGDLHADRAQAHLTSTLDLTTWGRSPLPFDLWATLGSWQYREVRGEPLPLTGHGTFDPATRASQGMLTADLADLAPWQAVIARQRSAAGTPGAGEARAIHPSADVRSSLGTGDAPTAGEPPTRDTTPTKTPTGKGRLQVHFNLTPGGERLGLNLQLGLRDLRDWSPHLAVLVGPTPLFSAQIVFRPREEQLTLEALRLTEAPLKLSGQATVHLPTRQLVADGQAELPDLRPLAALLQHPIAGQLRFKARMTGTLTAPEIEAEASGEKLLWNRQPIEQLQARLSAHHALDKPEGTLELTARFPEGRTRATTAFHADDRQVVLSRLKLTAPVGGADGQLRIDRADGLATGSLSGDLEHLAALAPLLDVPLAGRSRLHLDLDHLHGVQNAALHLTGQALTTPWGTAENLHLDLRGSDLRRQPQLNGTLTLASGHYATHTLEQLRVKIGGKGKELTLDLSARGEALHPFTLASAGTLHLSDILSWRSSGVTMTLDRLTGSWGQEALRLATPLRIAFKPTLLEIFPFDLTLGKARLVADLHAAPETLSGRAVLHLPLALVGPLLEKPWTGVVEGQVDLSGSARQPAAAGVINVTQWHATSPAWVSLPPLNVRTTLNLVGETLAYNATLSNLSQGSLQAAGTLPLAWRLLPWQLESPTGTTPHATVRADLRLEQLAALLELPQQELAGRLRGEVRIDGDAAQPRLNGTLHLTEGRYAHLDYGTELKNIELVAEARGQSLAITRLTAASGTAGHLSGSGDITLNPESGFPLRAELEMTQVVPVRNRMATALADGTLRLKGPLLSPHIAGSIILGQTDVLLANSETEDIDVIAVEEQVQGVPVATHAMRAPVSAKRPTLDLTLVSPGRFVTRGRGIDVEWSGEVKVTGPTDNPELRGLMQMRRGQVDFLGQKFQVVRGTIQLVGDHPANPIANLDATLQRKDLQATLHVQGPLRAPTLSFASDPPLAQDDIVANILFGRTTAEINPTQAASLALALRSLKEGGGNGFLDQFQQAIGVSKLDFTPGDRPETGVVKVGKYLNDQIFLQVERGLAPGTGGVSVEMDMTPNLSLKTDMHEEKSQEIGINWKHQY
ncbi:MAG: translocation/assembly module TamB domain-containing protein [Magnetococcales bacterium]|nr:translocation/assembly module TamB domain-containing protein [Magnetococcales bacterium]